jgi:hypothetical protein
VFGLPGTEADADNLLKLKITADLYSFCPELMLNSAQLLKIFPSARLLLKPPVGRGYSVERYSVMVIIFVLPIRCNTKRSLSPVSK